jgi:hypothetical protein
MKPLISHILARCLLGAAITIKRLAVAALPALALLQVTRRPCRLWARGTHATAAHAAIDAAAVDVLAVAAHAAAKLAVTAAAAEPAAAAAVAEPASVSLSSCGAAALLTRRRLT